MKCTRARVLACQPCNYYLLYVNGAIWILLLLVGRWLAAAVTKDVNLNIRREINPRPTNFNFQIPTHRRLSFGDAIFALFVKSAAKTSHKKYYKTDTSKKYYLSVEYCWYFLMKKDGGLYAPPSFFFYLITTGRRGRRPLQIFFSGRRGRRPLQARN